MIERRQEHDISGLEFSYLRGGSMSLTPAPESYLWHHSEVGVEDGDGTLNSSYATKQAWRSIRRTWLVQFPLIISENPEKGFRYWRWTDPQTGRIAWWERRPWSDLLPHEPGFWPDNGGYIES